MQFNTCNLNLMQFNAIRCLFYYSESSGGNNNIGGLHSVSNSFLPNSGEATIKVRGLNDTVSVELHCN